ncbi:MAG: hypothetical protein GXY08_09085 [Ruminococcus sp.]|nr:hypothetical protein [Ruminococcus sp.]
MKKKNELDILLNGTDDIIESLAHRPVLTERERKKMLEMSKKKLEDMKDGFVASDMDYRSGESVRGVESYKRSIIMKRIISAAACMVLVGGLGGTLFLMKKNGNNKGVKGDSSVINPAVATTTENDDNEIQTTIVSTALNGTTVTSVDTTATAGEAAVQTTTAVYSTPPEYGSDAVENAALTYMADFTARYDKLCMDIAYSLVDINKDGVPELLVASANYVTDQYSICVYDGHQYIDISPMEGEYDLLYGYSLMVSPDNGLIHTSGKNCPDRYMKLNSDNSLETVDVFKNWWDPDTDELGYWQNDVKITESEYNSIKAKYDSYNWIAPDYTDYAEHNGYIVDNAPLLYTDIDIKKLIECGELPAGDREICVCYGEFDYTIDPADVSINDDDQGGRAGEEYSPSDGKITDTFDSFGKGRKYRLRVEILDRGDEQYHKLLLADIDFATGECTILENRFPDAVDMHF